MNKSLLKADTILHKSYLLTINRKIPKKEKGREIRTYVTDTKSISRENLNDGTIRVGLATDNCWQFKVIESKINAYSFLSEKYDISTYNLCAFQVGKGIMQPLDPKALEKVVSANERAKKALDKKDYYKAILIFNRN